MSDRAIDRELERTRETWLNYLTGREQSDEGVKTALRWLFTHLPSDPRCRICRAPFRGVGSVVARSLGFSVNAWQMNPTLCNRCETFVRKHEVGVEIELTLLFADVRGSTQLAERLGPSDFHHLIDRFYRAATQILIETDALVDKLVGDEVIGLYVRGIAGPDYSRRAVEAARNLLSATGYGSAAGPWIELGVGVHTGIAYVGSVGTGGSVGAITVLGEAANVTARLASAAGSGELLISEATSHHAAIELPDAEMRTLELKGVAEPVTVFALTT